MSFIQLIYMMVPERTLLDSCKDQIEQVLRWGDSLSWTDREFDELSEKIFANTNVKLSVTTLKRVWGKVHYQGSFSPATLNALAHFLGFNNWRDFRDKSQARQTNDNTSAESKNSTKAAIRGRFLTTRNFVLLSAATLILLLIIYFAAGKKSISEPQKAPNYIYP